MLTKFIENMDIISALDDEPNDVSGLTAEEVKAEFDKGGKLLKDYINNILTEEMDAHINNMDNPHSVTKEQVGLGNCDNTADTEKPVSTPQQTALDLKADKTNVLEKNNTAEYTPTADYNPSTKKYVDREITKAVFGDVSIPIATETTFGGVKVKTADQINDLYEIGIDPATGKLYQNAFTAPSLLQASPEQINKLSASGAAADFWSIGDVTSWITLTTGEQIRLQIADFDHDDLTNGVKAGISFIMKDAFDDKQRMNSSNTNVGGWGSSALQGKMDTYLNSFPDEWKAVVKQVKKKTSAGNGSSSIVTSEDYLWLLSCDEVGFPVNTSYSPGGEGYVYPIFTDNTSRIKNVNGSACFWWLRSPFCGNATRFCRVYSGGTQNYDGASASYGVVVGLCI